MGDREKVLKLMEEELEGHKFTLLDYDFFAKPPSLLEEAKIPMRAISILKNILLKDKELLSEVSQQIDEEILDLNKREHLEKIFEALPASLRDLVNALAYLDTVVKKISYKDKILEEKPSDLFLSEKLKKVHYRDVIFLATNIFDWFEKEYSVDPFLSKD